MPASKRPGLVSHETVYATIYAQPRGELKKALIEALRRSKPRWGNRRTTAATGRSFVPEELRIQHRPEEIEGRLIPGHWEGDLIKGAYNRSAVGVLVERHSRYLILCKMDDGTAEAALEGFTRQMKKMPAFMRKSLTYDRGSEMACFRQLSERLNIDIWFCDPHAPWQQGSRAAGQQRKYQWSAAPVPAQGHGSFNHQPDPPERHCPTDERAPAPGAGCPDP